MNEPGKEGASDAESIIEKMIRKEGYDGDKVYDTIKAAIDAATASLRQHLAERDAAIKAKDAALGRIAGSVALTTPRVIDRQADEELLARMALAESALAIKPNASTK